MGTKQTKGRLSPENYEFFTVGELAKKLEAIGREYGAAHPDHYYALVYTPTMSIIDAGPDYSRLHEILNEITS